MPPVPPRMIPRIMDWSFFAPRSLVSIFSPMIGVTSFNVSWWWNLLLLRLTLPSICLHPPVGCARSCKIGFLKYWFIAHFRRPLSSYHSRIWPLSSEEVKMKEDMCFWYQSIDYEQGLVLVKYHILSEKNWIDTFMIISAPVSLRGKNYLVRRGTSFF